MGTLPPTNMATDRDPLPSKGNESSRYFFIGAMVVGRVPILTHSFSRGAAALRGGRPGAPFAFGRWVLGCVARGKMAQKADEKGLAAVGGGWVGAKRGGKTLKSENIRGEGSPAAEV